MAFNFFPVLRSFVDETIALDFQKVLNDEGLRFVIDVAMLGLSEVRYLVGKSSIDLAVAVSFWEETKKFKDGWANLKAWHGTPFVSQVAPSVSSSSSNSVLQPYTLTTSSFAARSALANLSAATRRWAFPASIPAKRRRKPVSKTKSLESHEADLMERAKANIHWVFGMFASESPRFVMLKIPRKRNCNFSWTFIVSDRAPLRLLVAARLWFEICSLICRHMAGIS